MSHKIFNEFRLGDITLSNRIVMSPMTRCRAINNIPNELMATYYQQRATAGLIITEGTAPSANGLGYARIPGSYSSAQKSGWQKITQAVHERGGHIFLQLMHTGRISHPDNMPPGTRIIAPSAIAAPGSMWTDSKGNQDFPVPEAMTEGDIHSAIEEYVHAATLAIDAGFDGVELHGANGYLIDQFLNTASNQRTDKWGGSPQNRIRFATEVAKAVVNEVGSQHVGMRLSPYGVASGMQPDPDMDRVYDLLSRELSEIGLVYVHLVDHSSMGAPEVKPAIKQVIRKNFEHALILSGGYDAKHARQDVDEDRADLIAFGRPFISNPDLVEKLKDEKTLTEWDANTFYTADEKGYTDYPLSSNTTA